MTETQKLLVEYSRNGSETAFRELVTRYVDLVYSTAVRLVEGDAHRAQDVTQTVFADLARRAGKLSGEVMLGGWLHRHTCFVAANVMRGERRRQQRERTAAEMNVNEDHSETNLSEIRPVLDDAINQLGPEDRTAILLRFFEKHDLRSVGEALGASENAAQKRLTRALEELRGLLKRRGVALSTAALGTALTVEAVSAAPVGLGAAVAATALTGAAAGSGATATFLNFMSMSKLKAGLVGAVAVAGLGTTSVVEYETRANIRSAGATYERQQQQLTALLVENDRLSNSLAASGPGANSLEELQRLRDAAANLRTQTNRLAVLEAEDSRLQAALRDARQSRSSLVTQSAELRQEGGDRVRNAMTLGAAVIEYAASHPDEVVTNLQPVLAERAAKGKPLTDFDPSEYELVFPRLWKDSGKLAHPDAILLLRQKQPWKSASGNLAKVYVYLTGGGTVLSPPSGNFDEWERQHMIAGEPHK